MDLDRYNEAAWKEMDWCVKQLRAEGVGELWRSGIALGAVGIEEILEHQGSEISEFLAMTPSQRIRRLAKIEVVPDFWTGC